LNAISYYRPKNLVEALKLLHEYASRAKVIAGGTNVLPDIQSGKVKDCVLVDVTGLDELSGIRMEGEMVFLGSLTVISDLAASRTIREQANVLWQACQVFGDPLVRNRATIGGNLAYASPAADTAVPLLILETTLIAESLAKGRREIPLNQFFRGPGETVLAPEELVTSLYFHNSSSYQSAYVKFGLRQAMAISLANCGVLLKETGTFQAARIGFGALAPVPLRATKTEAFLCGQVPDETVFMKAAMIAQSELQPISDLRGSKEYRVILADALFQQALRKALA
jgi:CO/xanthine dehydrogenase FAD-binding subunit